ncbi:MAG: hypothetical protein U0517_01480 [Candidatus Andersenbacteria bacterium]
MATNKVRHDTAILALILNILVLPGIGTLVAGRTTEGVLQLTLFLVSIPLCLILIGFPLMLAMWIWSLVTGIDILNKAQPN